MIVRIPRGAVAPGGGGGDELSAILARLAPAGALAKTAGKLTGFSDVGTGAAGALGLARGIANEDPGQAIGGAANLGSGLAGLMDYPGVSSALGGVGGPLTFATGLASGDPLSSAIGGIQTASLASGALGGPTLGSLAVPALEAGYMALPGATAEGLAALGLGGGISLGATAALAPIALMGMGALSTATGQGDLFDALFGENSGQEAKQMREYQRYAEAFPDLAKRRVAGAGVFDDLGEIDTSDEILGALDVAGSGRNANPEGAAWNLSHRPSKTSIKPMNLDAWNAAAPGLASQNWGAFQSLMDKGEAAGIDPGGHTGSWNLAPAGFTHWTDSQYSPDDTNRTGEDYRTKIGYNNQAQFDEDKNWIGGSRGQTQEAQDLGNAVGAIGGHLGIDWTQRGEGDYVNFDPEQISGYGFEPGKYGPATLNYLRSFDPTVTEHEDWDTYASSLDPGNTLAGLAPLTTFTPRKPMAPMVYGFQWGANDSPGG